MSCLTCPATFDIPDYEVVVKDVGADPMAGFAGMGGLGGMGGMNEDMRMAMVMNNGGMNPGLMNAENLGTG